jgi:hypothetical protein
MQSLRRLRRLVALATLAGWTLLHVQNLAYACPMDASAPDTPAALASETAAPQTSAAYELAAPCGEHCATRHSVLALPAPAVPVGLAPPLALRVDPAPLSVATLLAARDFSERRAERGDAVPLLIHIQVFRE